MRTIIHKKKNTSSSSSSCSRNSSIILCFTTTHNNKNQNYCNERVIVRDNVSFYNRKRIIITSNHCMMFMIYTILSVLFVLNFGVVVDSFLLFLPSQPNTIMIKYHVEPSKLVILGGGGGTTKNDFFQLFSMGSSSSSTGYNNKNNINIMNTNQLSRCTRRKDPKRIQRMNPFFFRTSKRISSSFSSSSSQLLLSSNSNNEETSLPFLFDRFKATCPANVNCIRLFDPKLLIRNNDDTSDDDDDIWVAVYRSNNNQPSILIQDQFFQAMKIATTSTSNSESSSSTTTINNSIEINSMNKPVAVARLQKKQKILIKQSDSTTNTDNDDTSFYSYTYVLDCMRCTLKKEKQDTTCDGGSEHTEALGTAIDTLILYYLQNNLNQNQNQHSFPIFESMIQTKATLVSAPLLEQRGFQEVTTIQKDITITHTSSLDDSIIKYTERCATLFGMKESTTSSSSSSSADTEDDNDEDNAEKKRFNPMSCSPAVRQRSLDIITQLGQIDRNKDLQAAISATRSQQQQVSTDDDNNDTYDPWAGSKNIM